MSDREAEDTARDIWTRINGVNLRENILPTRTRADLILEKGARPPDRAGPPAEDLRRRPACDGDGLAEPIHVTGFPSRRRAMAARGAFHVRSGGARAGHPEGGVPAAGAASCAASCSTRRRALRDAPFPVIVVFAGVDGAGKGETVNLLQLVARPALGRHARVRRAVGRGARAAGVLALLAEPAAARPDRALPEHAGTRSPVLDRVYRRIDAPAFDERLDRIVDFERTLTDDGALILKFWMHLDKAAQKKRLTKLEKDPLTRWRVTKLEWKHWRMYDRFIDAAERADPHDQPRRRALDHRRGRRRAATGA